MEMISAAHIERIRANTGYKLLWGGGPPDNPADVEIANRFITAMAKTGSIEAAQVTAEMDDYTMELFLCRSPWFCERINFAVNKMLAEMKMSAISRAIGFTKEDPTTGLPEVDATGRIKRFNASDTLAQTFLKPASISGTDLSGKEAESEVDPGPLSPSNVDAHRQLQIDDCRLALDALRPAVRAGDRQAIDSFTKVQDRLAKLSGTDAPKQTISYTRGDGAARLRDDELEAIAAQGVVYLKQGEDGTYSPGESDE